MSSIATRLDDLTARDLMEREVLTLPTTTTLAQALALFEENHISGAPVVEDSTGRVVGVFSAADLVRGDRIREERRPLRWYRAHVDEVHMEEDLADEDPTGESGWDLETGEVSACMTPTVLSVRPDLAIRDIAQTMVDEGVHRLLVVENDRLIGIVTTMDLTRALANA